LGLAFYIQLSSLRRTARALSEIHKVSKTAACEWVRRFSGKVNVNPCLGGLTVLGEACVKVNGLEYWVYAALDVDRNEIISMMVHPSRNALAAEQFIREVLNYCEGKPTFMVDSAPWLRQALEELGLTYNAESFRR